jgi:hypothetical protein
VQRPSADANDAMEFLSRLLQYTIAGVELLRDGLRSVDRDWVAAGDRQGVTSCVVGPKASLRRSLQLGTLPLLQNSAPATMVAGAGSPRLSNSRPVRAPGNR